MRVVQLTLSGQKQKNGPPCNDSSCGWLIVFSSVSSFTYNSPLQSIVINAEGNLRARMTQLLCVTSMSNPLYIPYRYSVPTLLVLYLYPHPAIPRSPPLTYLSAFSSTFLRTYIPTYTIFLVFYCAYYSEHFLLCYKKRWKSIML